MVSSFFCFHTTFYAQSSLIVVFEVVENFEATEKQQISHLIKKNQEGRKKKKKSRKGYWFPYFRFCLFLPF